MFLWVNCTHKIPYPKISIALSNFYQHNTYHLQRRLFEVVQVSIEFIVVLIGDLRAKQLLIKPKSLAM